MHPGTCNCVKNTCPIRRANASKNIAFGFGPHVCIGKRVAQLQLEEVYRQSPPPEKMPVRFTPQRSA